MNKTPQELADYLRRANIWRRSNIDDPMPEPTELGEAIDQAIAILEEVAHPPTCMTCDHWHPHHPWDGWCPQLKDFTHNTETCDKHVPIEIKPTQQTNEKHHRERV